VAVQAEIRSLQVSAMFVGAQALCKSILSRDDAAHVEAREKSRMLLVLQLQSISAAVAQAGLSPAKPVVGTAGPGVRILRVTWWAEEQSLIQTGSLLIFFALFTRQY
jgi:hypothetical protein